MNTNAILLIFNACVLFVTIYIAYNVTLKNRNIRQECQNQGGILVDYGLNQFRCTKVEGLIILKGDN